MMILPRFLAGTWGRGLGPGDRGTAPTFGGLSTGGRSWAVDEFNQSLKHLR
ncbi:hypothetical protein [Sulfitobacter faviae]|uniref:hypothetical protein n=1 Tax=Sulfitobacter faviae TaxID=1775881 RepID=UPI002456553D|nr:hypothetical protein [Sulfitobacter faviae]